MAITIEAYAVTETVSTTEWSLTTDSAGPDTDTTDGIYQVWLDLSALQAGDIFELYGYEKIQGAGTQRKFLSVPLVGVQAVPGYPCPSYLLGSGWDFTLLKISGTDRAIVTRISKVA